MAEVASSVKLVLIGDSGVGKTCLVQRYANNTFPEGVGPTIGGAFVSKDVQVDRTTVTFQIWDTAGQERYRSLTAMYYRGTHAALACFSITDRTTFEGAKRWLTELQRNGVNNAVVFLVGNKLDLSQSRQVSEEEARVFAKARGLDYVEVSAKADIGVRGVFDAVARRLPAAQSSILASQEQAFSAQLELLDIHEALASPVSAAERSRLEARARECKAVRDHSGRGWEVEGKTRTHLGASLREIRAQMQQVRSNAQRSDSSARVALQTDAPAKKGCCG